MKDICGTQERQANALARVNDPQTSKDAAVKMVKGGALSRQEEKVLYTIKFWYKDKDFTTKDIAVKMLGYPYYKAYDICRKRFSGLHDKGKIARTSKKRDGCCVWRLL